jgi:uncharacterized membrane protein YadS
MIDNLRSAGWWSGVDNLRSAGWWSGVAIAVGVSVLAGYVATWVGVGLLGFEKSPISAIMMAIVLGMVIANSIALPASIQLGLKFCTSGILQVGIMLLGIRLSLLSAGQFTLVALPFVLAAIAAGLLTVGLVGRYMGLSKQLSGLIAVGTSICGCTAIVALCVRRSARARRLVSRHVDSRNSTGCRGRHDV